MARLQVTNVIEDLNAKANHIEVEAVKCPGKRTRQLDHEEIEAKKLSMEQMTLKWWGRPAINGPTLINESHDFGLTDVSFKGPITTWNNHRNGSNNVQERLDCGLASTSCLFHYLNALSYHLEDIGSESSDHHPVLFKFHSDMVKANNFFLF